jgi:hypothetical protein
MKLKYFLPDWEDRLDPEFNFLDDKYSEGHKEDPYEHDIYAHQLFGEPPYDGILFSLSVFQSKISLNGGEDGNYRIRRHNSIKKYLKIPEGSALRVMGDCGAFGYVKEKEPPQPFYSVENVAQLYEKLGFDYGVSVDHLVVDYVFVKNKRTGKRYKKTLSKKEKDRRIGITLENAERFLEIHREREYGYTPIGVAQGYDLDTYSSSVDTLVGMGYEYIGIGGLVQYRTDFILRVLEKIQLLVKNKAVHLFGISRPNHLKDFRRLGVTSVDSASFFRKAWLRSGQNYLAPDGSWYTAIRVPQASNPRITKNADINGFSLDNLREMEKEALQALAEYEQGKINIDRTLAIILNYDKLLLRHTDDGEKLGGKYRRTLLEMPWKECNCDICKEIGIHVIIFRGCNRNKRRGFHNIWVLRNIGEDYQ